MTDNIKMDVCFEDESLVEKAQYRVHWSTIVSTVLDLWVFAAPV